MFEVNILGIRKKRKKGAQKKGGENSPISPPLDPRLQVPELAQVPEVAQENQVAQGA